MSRNFDAIFRFFIITSMNTSVKLAAIKASEEAVIDLTEYASIVEDLMFAACVIRSDIMCAVGQLLPESVCLLKEREP